MNHHLIILEHPVPVGPAVDAHGGFVGADDPRTAQAGEDRRNFVVEARLGAPEDGIQRALADVQAKQVLEQPAQALVADGVGEAQIDRQRRDVRAEGRGLLHSLGHWCYRDTAATRAMPGVTLHPGHHRANRWQIDPVVARVQHLVSLGQSGVAVHAGDNLGGDSLVGVARQRPAATGATQAATARSDTLDFLRPVRLLPLRRRHAGIVRGLRRLAQLCFEFANPPLGRSQALP